MTCHELLFYRLLWILKSLLFSEGGTSLVTVPGYTKVSVPGFQKRFHGRESKRNSNKSIPTGPPNHCNFLLNLSGHVADLQGGFDLTPLTYLEHCSTIICNIFFLFSALLQNSWTCLTIPWYPFCQNSSTL